MNPTVVLSVAGLDPGAGAGLLCDLKTFSALGTYGLGVISASTIQNTHEVRQIYPTPPDQLYEQIDCLFDDFTISAIKTGMVGSSANLDTLAKIFSQLQLCPLVVDPVLVSSTGTSLLGDGTVARYKETLIQLATLVTPNLFEAQLLSGVTIDSVASIELAARSIYKLGAKNVLIKGGHLPEFSLQGISNMATDFLFDGDHLETFSYPFIDTRNNHGTGCSLSSAICSYLALGNDMINSVKLAKQYVQKALLGSAGWTLGKGHGPLDHFFLNNEAWS